MTIEIGIIMLALAILWGWGLYSPSPRHTPSCTPKNIQTFEEQMRDDFIPRVWKMAENERQHLNWLIENNASPEMIQRSREYLDHFIQRHKDYSDYIQKIN